MSHAAMGKVPSKHADNLLGRLREDGIRDEVHDFHQKCGALSNAQRSIFGGRQYVYISLWFSWFSRAIGVICLYFSVR